VFCILAEQAPEHTALVFTELDPRRRRGRERARFQIASTPDAQYDWDLSTDWNQIAILRQPEGTITFCL
jgi:hypothetical protein